MALVKSPYTDVAAFSKDIASHVSEIVTMKYQATSVSDSNVRFRVTSPGVNSLMNSEVTLVMRMKITPKNSAGTTVNILPQKARVWRNGFRDAGFIGGDDARELAAGAGMKLKSEREVALNNTPENYGVCERFAGMLKACQSITVELNSSSSISVRPDRFIHLSEMFLVSPEEQAYFYGGAPDSGSGGHFLGRAYTIHSPDHNEISLVEHEIDRGMAQRCGVFRERCVPKGVETTQAGVDLGFEYIWVTRLPICPMTMFQNGYGSGRKSYLPYISTMSVHLSFKPEPSKFASMFQCTALVSNERYGSGTIKGPTSAVAAANINSINLNGIAALDAAQAATPVFGYHPTGKVEFIGTPELIVNWVAPGPTMQLKPSYSFSLPRTLDYVHTIPHTDIKFSGARQNRDAITGKFWTAPAGYNVAWRNVRLDVMPDWLCLWCRPMQGSCTAAPDITQFRNSRDDCSYCETFDSIYSGQEGDAVSLRVQIAEKAGLALTYSARDLFRILKKNCPNYKHTYETWLRDKCVILLRPEDLPAPKAAGVFSSTNLNISCNWVRGAKHYPLVGSSVHTTDLRDTGGVPVAGLKSECVLTFFFEDVLSLSQSSSSTAAFIVEEAALRGVGSAQVNQQPAIDNLAL